MDHSNLIAWLLISFFGGAALAAGLVVGLHRVRLGTYQKMSSSILHQAEIEAEAIRKTQDLAFKHSQIEQQREFEQLWQGERRKLQREEERLKQREDKIESRMNVLEKKVAEVEKKEAFFLAQKELMEKEKIQLAATQASLVAELERISGLTSAEGKEVLLSKLEQEVKTEAAHLIRRTKKEAEEVAEKEATRILVTAINRMAVASVSDATVHTISLPHEEMKGRIIGREGRNIRALERATGVNFIIDDTPGAIVLSGFDPVRMQIAKAALSDLIKDGRIHPTRIEEAVEMATANVHKHIKQSGESAALNAGAISLNSELVQLLGRLKFRYSHGQNVLDHSIEVSYLMGLMAAELGLDIRLAKRIGLLHDIGKAVTHEIEGSHAVVGHDLALRYGESKEVANGIGCHHQEMDPATLEGSLCSAADAISASRQGARSEPVEEYIKRLQRLEEIAQEYPGVEKAFALQAGREVRIAVVPELINDDGIITLARDLTKRIENELRYPSKIKVTVIRETRAVEYAV